MGNFHSSCFLVKPRIAKLIDVHGNLRPVKVPITAAEIMLEEPGFMVSSVEDVLRTRRIPVMKADEELSAGSVYLLVPTSRAHRKASELELALIEEHSSGRKKGRPPTRRSSKVLPEVVREGFSGEKDVEQEEQMKVMEEGGDSNGMRRNIIHSRRWRPLLEPISEGA